MPASAQIADKANIAKIAEVLDVLIKNNFEVLINEIIMNISR
jgi:hypothetical protein